MADSGFILRSYIIVNNFQCQMFVFAHSTHMLGQCQCSFIGLVDLRYLNLAINTYGYLDKWMIKLFIKNLIQFIFLWIKKKLKLKNYNKL